ncbi:MAG: hypothetical protein JO033_12670 [Acidobacteriaceae bacterium]|nr:hypothetical protein [Acidobacteriaceae bacterium]
MDERQLFFIDDSAPTSAHGPMFRESAWRRVGFTDEALRKWLLEFGRIDLEQVDSKRRTQAQEELKAFIELWKTPAAQREVKFGACPPPLARLGTAIPEPDALESNRWLRELLTNLAQNQPTSFTPQITCTVSRVQNHQGWALTHQISGSDLDVFKYETYTAFAASVRGHQPCARCGRIFVPHGRSLYCSKRCGAVARTLRWRANKARWRKEHPEETRETAHRQYKRRVQKTKGASLKVTRRPRKGFVQ